MADVRMTDAEANTVKPVMRCCGVADVEGTSVSGRQKINQALQGIFIPHLPEEHDRLPVEFPSHRYKCTPRAEEIQSEDVLEVFSNEVGLANEYDAEHFANAFPTLFPFGLGTFGRKGKHHPISWEWQIGCLL